MKFSKSGDHFAIIKKHGHESNIPDELQVFDSKDILKTFSDIENDTPLLRFNLNSLKNGSSKHIRFDIQDKFVAVAFKTSV